MAFASEDGIKGEARGNFGSAEHSRECSFYDRRKLVTNRLFVCGFIEQSREAEKPTFAYVDVQTARRYLAIQRNELKPPTRNNCTKRNKTRKKKRHFPKEMDAAMAA